MNKPEDSQLGRTSSYPKKYDKNLLFPIPRCQNRAKIGIGEKVPFVGYDIWNAWEVSFLNQKGKPVVCIASLTIPCDSEFIVESKSLKLYLNSFNDHQFNSLEHVQETITKDLSECINAEVNVVLSHLDNLAYQIQKPYGVCLDDLDITFKAQAYNSNFITADKENLVNETLYSNLLKSNCPVTSQPDWATVTICYSGKKLDHANLLRYLLSFRGHNEFHEQCVERIFQDISQIAQPKSLTVTARYTRRGGIDINPIRSSEPIQSIENPRFIRQ